MQDEDISKERCIVELHELRERVAELEKDKAERNRAQDLRQTHLHPFYNILSNLHAGVLLVTEDRQVEFANQSFCDLFDLGCSPEELRGLSSSEMIDRIQSAFADPVGAVEHICEILDRGLPVKSGEVALHSGRTCLRDFIPLHLGGKRYGQLWHLQDITERKRAEETLRESEERYRTMMDQAADAVFVHDETGRILDVNRKACESLGYSREELLSRSIGDIDPAAIQTGKHELWGKILAGEHFTFESRQTRKDGSTIPVEVTLGSVRLPLCPAVLGIVRDNTERKRAEAERIRLERQLQQVRKAESLGRMASAIAHHFNNKLMVVSGNLELALIHAGPSQTLSGHLLKAQRAIAQAAEVSSVMLAYLGRAMPKADALDLAKVCRELIEAQRTSIPQRAALKIDIPLHGPKIKAHPTQVRQVLSNLIVNAGEAIGEGEGEIRVSLRILDPTETSSPRFFPTDWKPEKDTYACFEVSDTGCGIDPEQLDSIFDPFFSTRLTGRGLGLAVVLGTVRSYGGAIAVESEPGRGSMFQVFWPVAEPEAQTVHEAQADVSKPMKGFGLVLFVDDEAQLRDMAEMMLGVLGFDVIKAGHGLEALEFFRERKDEINLVILDLTMPGMNGWETLAALRALRPDIPVVLASGYDEAKVMEGEHAELPQAFLHKPYRMAELEAAIAAAVVMPSVDSMKPD
jgi:PAS domain S-box-containing protein